MDDLQHFTIHGDRAEYRPVGQFTLGECVELVASAIAQARARDIRKLLVSLLGCTGFDPPGLGQRYFLVERWSRVAGGLVTLAVVPRPEMLDPAGFGETVAANMGLRGRGFVSEAEAVAWLEGQ